VRKEEEKGCKGEEGGCVIIRKEKGRGKKGDVFFAARGGLQQPSKRACEDGWSSAVTVCAPGLEKSSVRRPGPF